jgi:hypothetical protein
MPKLRAFIDQRAARTSPTKPPFTLMIGELDRANEADAPGGAPQNGARTLPRTPDVAFGSKGGAPASIFGCRKAHDQFSRSEFFHS